MLMPLMVLAARRRVYKLRRNDGERQPWLHSRPAPCHSLSCSALTGPCRLRLPRMTTLTLMCRGVASLMALAAQSSLRHRLGRLTSRPASRELKTLAWLPLRTACSRMGRAMVRSDKITSFQVGSHSPWSLT
ncbi:hypothetical protein OH76DRAFT_514384 [Lentinus brumalis]|uniref:Uncharacterized protein n=1 Tax=Lentinus brumalis TaxID=2498619 RepID=A0A371DBC9_9APHY|nr:hypothetical protein OH76DRAFT_514384 [Polyporus brumalis]